MKKSIRNGKFRLFTGMTAGAALASLVFALAFSACPSPTGGDAPEDLDKTGLEASITAAGNAKAGVAVKSNAAEVPLGTQWVTEDDWNTFDAAITAAKNARDTKKTQADINSAKTTLDNAIAAFNSAKKDGTGTPLNTAALAAKIAEAETARAGVQQAANASEVVQGTKWVTTAVWNAFDSAITAAKDTLTATVQSTVDDAVAPLATAITTFNSAKQNGDKTAGFSAADLTALITQANAAKAGVTVSTNGNDVSPTESWVSQSSLTALTTAITNAQAANDGNRDTLYLALAGVLTTFNSAKATGTVPDKTALNATIEAANTAQQDVVEAASKADAPLGSKWATAAQFAPLTTAYTAALAALNGSATKNAVDTAASALSQATTTFNSAVTGNGPGEKDNGGGGFNPQNVTTLTENTWADGTLSASTAEQWFKFTATVTGSQYIHVTPGTMTQVYVQVYTSTGTAVGSQATLSGSSTYTGRSVSSGEGYYIKVTPSGSTGGDYLIGFNTGIALPLGATLTENTWASGSIPATGSREQWFKFTATFAAQYIHFKGDTLTAAYVQLYDRTGTAAGDRATLSGSSTYTTRSVSSGEDYYIKVTPTSSLYSGSYQIGFNTGIVLPLGATLTENTWASGSIPATGSREQWFKFTATFAAQYIHFKGGTLTAANVQLYDRTGTAADGQAALSGSSTYTTRSVSSGEDYYIKVTPTSSSDSGDYQIGFNASLVPPGSVTLTENTWASGSIPATGSREQWFQFTATVTGDQYIHVYFSGLSSMYVQVYDRTGTAVGTNTSLSNGSGDTNSTYRSVTSGQVYYIKVTPSSSTNSGGYKIGFGGIAPPDSVTLTENTWARGYISSSSTGARVGWFKFTATAATQYIHFTLAQQAKVAVVVVTSTGTMVGSQTSLGSGNRSTSRSVTSGEDYYIRVTPLYTSIYNPGSYSIAFNASIAVPGSATLTADTWEDGSLPQIGEQWFQFTATVTGSQFIHFAPGTLRSVYVQVYASTGTEVGSLTAFDTSSRSTSRGVTSGQVYYIKVTPSSSTISGGYQIAFNAGFIPPGISPTTLTADTWEDGSLPQIGEQWFQFTATVTGSQFIHFAPGTLLSVGVKVYASTGTEVGSYTSLSSSGTKYISRSVTSGQVYYIKVNPPSSTNGGGYKIAFNTSSTP